MSRRFTDARVLITGGGGFIGQYLAARLNFEGADVMTVDAARGSTATLVQDVTQPFDVPGQVDVIVHAAGIGSAAKYIRQPKATLDVSVLGTRNMLELARRKEATLVFFSSSEIYGEADVTPTPETYNGNVSSLGPRAAYDEGKRVGETYCWAYAQEGVAAVIARLSSVYGPGMPKDDGRLTPNFARALVERTPIQVDGGGGQTRVMCYVSDAVEGVMTLMLAGKPGEAYNVGNDRPEVTVEQVARLMLAIAGPEHEVPIQTREVAHRQGPTRRVMDLTKIRALGYEPKVDLEDGLNQFWDWAHVEYSR